MNRSIRPAIVLALIALTCIGCARRDRMPPVNVGYEQLRETFTGVDFSPLQGRRILLDPGHGGMFPGVVGHNGLSEADVNLGVSLYLRGLLEAAGARVWMTRTTDRDFVSPADSSLAVDLAARVTMCDTLRPDVFLTLHHNSNAALDRDMNETQTYYPVGRDGADLDLARAIHRHLVRNLDIRPAKIMAGNFYVLRNAPQGVPSVLGEPSMLSNPLVEEKLMTAEKMELEAQAYFLGLQEYFAGGQPFFTIQHPSAFAQIRYRFHADIDSTIHSPGLDPTSVRVTRDEETVPHTLSANGCIVTAPALEGGVYRVSARNLAGRSVRCSVTSTRSCGKYSPQRAGALDWTLLQETSALRPQRALITWTGSGVWYPRDLSSEFPLNLIRRSSTTGAMIVPLDSIPTAHLIGDDHQRRMAPAFAAAGGQDGIDGGRSIAVTGRLIPLSEGFRWALIKDDLDLAMKPGRARLGAFEFENMFEPRRMFPDGDGNAYVPIASTGAVWWERLGCSPLIRTSDDPWQDTLTWRAVAPHLIGKTIILDPAGGGPDDQGLAPMGTPGRELNLRVAERLAALLRGAGANPILTRTDAGWVPKEHKVLLTNREHGALFLTVARNTSEPGARLFHHYGSRNGERWARLTAAALVDAGLAETGADTLPVGPSYAYLLRHTAPPALRLELPMPTTEDSEDLARTPAAQQAEALALFRAVAAYFESEADLPAGWDLSSFMARHRNALPHPDDVDLVRVDGNWLWLPPVAGAPAALLPPVAGLRTLEIRSGDQWWLMEADPAAGTLNRKLHGIGNRVLTSEQSQPPRPEVLHAPEGD